MFVVDAKKRVDLIAIPGAIYGPYFQVHFDEPYLNGDVQQFSSSFYDLVMSDVFGQHRSWCHLQNSGAATPSH